MRDEGRTAGGEEAPRKGLLMVKNEVPEGRVLFASEVVYPDAIQGMAAAT